MTASGNNIVRPPPYKGRYRSSSFSVEYYLTPIMSGEGNFVVLPASSQEDFDFVTKMCKEEQWLCIGNQCVTHMGRSKPGFFIGYLNGQRIGHVGVFEYGDDSGSFFHIGFYIVDKTFRGKGYGLKIWNVMWESLPKECNIALDGLMDKVPLYERIGFRQEWLNKEYTVLSSKVVEGLQKVKKSSSSAGIEVKSLNEVEFEKLLEYDASVFGFVRREFLQKWITIPECLGWVATDKKGDIVGYVVIQHSIAEEQQVVGPFFSDDLHTTRILLLKVAEEAIQQRSAKKLRLWVPAIANPETAKMIETEIGYESIWEAMRMYTKGVPPKVCVKKIVVITSPGFQ